MGFLFENGLSYNSKRPSNQYLFLLKKKEEINKTNKQTNKSK
jgi:hypothetical protein